MTAHHDDEQSTVSTREDVAVAEREAVDELERLAQLPGRIRRQEK